MTIKEKIKKNIQEAAKGKKELELGVFRLLLADILSREKEKRYKLSKEKPELNQQELEKQSLLNDEEVLEAVSSAVKRRKESISGFEKGGRTDLAEKEKKEMEILKEYMPEQLSEDEVKDFIKKAIQEVEAQDIKDIGKVMGVLMPKLKGKADGAMVSRVVKELLSKEN